MAKKLYLEDVADRSLALIDDTLKDLERLRKRAKARREEEGLDEELDIPGLNALQKTTQALSGLLAQLRQLAKDNREQIGNIGPSERQKLMLDYFASLPEEHMYMYLLQFKALYDERRAKHTELTAHGEALARTPDDTEH